MISIEEKKRERERNRNDDWRENNRDNFTSGLIRLCLIVEQQFFLAIVKLENKSERFYISFVSYHVLFNFRSRFFESRMVRKLKKKKKKEKHWKLFVHRFQILPIIIGYLFKFVFLIYN